jgi:RNA polymerase sigma-70 factor (ECF subfamily)
VDTPDGVLVARLCAGDEEALEEAYDRFGALVYGVAKRTVRNPAAAEDVVQEVFTHLWTHPERFDPARGSLRAFLGMQAHGRAIDAVRSESSRSGREQRHFDLDSSQTRSPSDDLEAASVQALVKAAIGRLPEEQRQVVELAYFGGYTHRELASILGIPEGTAKSRIRSAQSKLSAMLAPELELA